MKDVLDTPENWRKVSNCELPVGSKVMSGGHECIITGFGPYFIWVEDQETGRERKSANWKEISDES